MKPYIYAGTTFAFGAAAAMIHRSWVLSEDDTVHPAGVNMGGTGMTPYNFSGTTKEPSAVRLPLASNLATMPKSADPVDVCVIGGGFAGLHAALALAERGKKVVLLEGKRIGAGASGRNGGDALIGFHTSVDELADWARSKDTARELFSHTEMGFERLKSLIGKYRIQCDPKEHGAITMGFTTEKNGTPDVEAIEDVKEVNKEFKQKLEYKDKKALEAAGIVSDRYRCGTYEPRNITLNPLELCFGLARACESTGNVSIFENSNVEHVEHDTVKGRFNITTNGGSVQARKCVLATNHAPASIAPWLAMRTTPVSTSAILTAPLPKEKLDKCLSEKAPACFDDRFGLAYFRRLPGDRIMYGCFASGLPLRNGPGGGGMFGALFKGNGSSSSSSGGSKDDKSGHHPSIGADQEKSQTALLHDLMKTFPSLSNDLRADRWWAGRLSVQFPIFPLVGRDKSTGLYYSLGYAGHGIVPTCAAGKIIANAIVDGNTDALELWGQVVPWWLPAGGPSGYVGATMACAMLRWWDSSRGRC